MDGGHFFAGVILCLAADEGEIFLSLRWGQHQVGNLCQSQVPIWELLEKASFMGQGGPATALFSQYYLVLDKVPCRKIDGPKFRGPRVMCRQSRHRRRQPTVSAGYLGVAGSRAGHPAGSQAGCQAVM